MRDEIERRLRWRCRRGLLELDVWLERIAGKDFAGLSEAQCHTLEKLLEEADLEVLAWLQGRQPVPDGYVDIVSAIRRLGDSPRPR